VDCPVDIYAQADKVSAYSLSTGKVEHLSGTSYAAPQVVCLGDRMLFCQVLISVLQAGMAAYFLAHPNNQERFK
jgi:hypothetical protein